ncbi:flippase [Thiothrix lacustris]|uniref:flippase n=1 Tax=Thiothrix lacustris TaxID=525917 RepID=UPI00049080ED|nr:flippase [Thiothrix lacustris]
MRNIRKNIVFSGLGYALPLLASLASIPIIISQLGVDLYGLYIICVSLIGFMTLVDLGIGQTVIKYVAQYEATGQQDKVKPVLGAAFLIYLVIGLLSVACLYVSAPWLAAGLYELPVKQVLATDVLRITAVPLFFSYINQFFLNVCRAYHRFDLPAILHNVGSLGGMTVTAGLLMAGYVLRDVMWGYAFIQFVAVLGGYVASVKVLPIHIKPRPAFERHIFLEIISFSAYTFVGNFVGSLVSRADKLLIGVVIGTEAVTYYQIPFTIAQMANGIIHSLTHIAFPRFSEMFSLRDRVGLQALYRLANDAVFLISTVIAVMLITVGGDFLALWITPDFSQKATVVLQVMAVYFFLHSNTVVGYWVLQGGGQAKLTAFMSVIDAIAYFVALYYLGDAYGYMGAAVALFFTLLTVPLQYIWIDRHVGHSWLEYLIQLLTFSLVGYSIIYCMESLNVWLNDSLLEIGVNAALLFGLLLLALWSVRGRKVPNSFQEGRS